MFHRLNTYGTVKLATLKTSHDGGVVTAFILFSDVQDEIDYEFVGYNLTNPQSNYYSQGILNYNNSRNSSVNNTFEYYHNYEMDWTEDKIEWYIDGEKVRTLNKKILGMKLVIVMITLKLLQEFNFLYGRW